MSSTQKPWKLHGVVAVVLAATVAQVLLISPVVHAANGGGLRRSVEEAPVGTIDSSHRDLGKAKRKNQRAQHEKSELRKGAGKTKGNPGKNIKSLSDSFIIKGDKIIVLSGDDGDEGRPVGDKKPGKLRPNSGGVKPNAANSQDPKDWNDMGYQSGTKNMIPLNGGAGGAYYINDKTDTIYVTKGSGGNGNKPGKKKPQKKQMKPGGGSKNKKTDKSKSGGIKPGKDKPSAGGSGLNEFGFISGSQEKPTSDALNGKGDIVVKRGKGI
mmetsp:Transcript_22154/g.52349  ORF Transcript_22154/g.52349 Transcript_22154/m.52349 type:complete len:268 (+) Transcript_22154:221-1024(+)